MKSLKRNIFQRLFGICATAEPQNGSCWNYADGKITIDLSLAPELEKPGSGIRIESKDCPERVLVVYGDDCQFYAFQNKCQHAGRRMDPVPGERAVQCCSIGKSTYDYEGKVISGRPKGPITAYPVTMTDGKLTIALT